MRKLPSRLLLPAGLAAFALAAGVYAALALTHPRVDWMDPVDLRVYRFGGFIAAHVAPWYNSHRISPLYDWPGYLNLKFTYPPFAALVFTILTVPALPVLLDLSIVVNAAAFLATIWFTLGGLAREPALAASSRTVRARAAQARDVRGRAIQRPQVRAGVTLLLAAVLFWSEPVQRTIFLGQIELVLMALIMWDLCQPDRRRWKGAGVGLAAGIKLVPLIFIPYLLLTRRWRQAAVASGTFALTVAAGFLVLPADSARWWFGGIFARSGRTGFVGWEGNQSLQAISTRLAGSIAAGHGPWLVAAALTLVAGLAAAAAIDRAGYPVGGVVTCAITGLLVSPISWDHHWVWIAPGVTALAWYAASSRSVRRLALAAVAAGVAVAFGAWPTTWLNGAANGNGFPLGLIWLPPSTDPGIYYRLGDRRWYPEYHWRGLQLLTGNLYVLTGLFLLTIAVAAAVRLTRADGARRGSIRPDRSSTASATGAARSTIGAPTT